MTTPKSATRAYRSPLRAEKAARTRRLIVDSAAVVFAQRGYAGATMQLIAQQADVSVESVHAVGTKTGLLVMAFRDAYAGGSAWTTILEEPDLVRIMSTEGNDEAIAAYAEFIAEANRRSGGLWPAVRTAALSEPRVAQQINEMIALKRQDFLTGIGWYVSRGMVPEGTDPATVAPYLYVLTSQETYDQLRHDWGYSLDAYTEWLTQAIRKLAISSSAMPPPDVHLG